MRTLHDSGAHATANHLIDRNIQVKSLREMMELGHTVVLNDYDEEVYKALRGSGHLDSHMVTLAAPGDGKRRPPEWYRKNFHNVCAWYRTEYDERPQWSMVLNRGYRGIGQWSAHVNWVNTVPLHVECIVDRWNTLYGTERAMLSPHSNGLRYIVKNMGQPDARTYSGAHNRRIVRKRGKGFLTAAEVAEKRRFTDGEE